MFYEVKVLDAKGKIKKVISPKTLSDRFWKENFIDNQGSGTRVATVSGTDLDFETKDEPAEEESAE